MGDRVSRMAGGNVEGFHQAGGNGLENAGFLKEMSSGNKRASSVSAPQNRPKFTRIDSSPAHMTGNQYQDTSSSNLYSHDYPGKTSNLPFGHKFMEYSKSISGQDSLELPDYSINYGTIQYRNGMTLVDDKGNAREFARVIKKEKPDV